SRSGKSVAQLTPTALSSSKRTLLLLLGIRNLMLFVGFSLIAGQPGMCIVKHARCCSMRADRRSGWRGTMRQPSGRWPKPSKYSIVLTTTGPAGLRADKAGQPYEGWIRPQTLGASPARSKSLHRHGHAPEIPQRIRLPEDWQ